MNADPRDTIAALASAPGYGARAIVRLSGERARDLAAGLCTEPAAMPSARGSTAIELRLSQLDHPVPATVYFWLGPHSYTGDDLVEFHLLASPPLVQQLLADLLAAGARAGQPGEFTLRAFLRGKLDLPRAEAVLAVIEASDQADLQPALAQLAGGLSQPLSLLRDDLLNLLADLEAGMDFADEDISFVPTEDALRRLAAAMAHLTLLQKQLVDRALADQPFRVALVGPPNAGKSSLFNSLAGAGPSAALVSPEAGTTRDYLVRRVTIDSHSIDLIDTAGWQAADGSIAAQAQALSRDQTQRADLLLACTPAGELAELDALAALPIPTLRVHTKCDLATPPTEGIATSASSGTGLDTLKSAIAKAAHERRRSPLAPSLSRCRHHVDRCLQQLRKAHQSTLFEDPAEVVALELRGALDELGAMVGAIYTDDLLDRIFSRFCIGK